MRPLALLLLALTLGACSDDAGAGEGEALAGEREGTERWIVVFGDEPLDVTALREARASGAGVREAESALREKAAERRKDFVKALKELDGVVVEYWALTNAVTVEVPSGNVGTLRRMDGVKELRADRLIE